MTTSERPAKKKSMFDVSPDAANLWYNISTYTSIIAAGLALLGAVGSAFMSAKKEEFANQSAETERSARLEIERKLAPRHLSAEQIRIISEAAGKFPGQAIKIYSPLGDSEAERYAGEFFKLFTAAGWNAEGMSAAFRSPKMGLSLGISSEDFSSPPPGAEPLIKALESLNLLNGAVADQSVPKGSIAMIVGAKQN